MNQEPNKKIREALEWVNARYDSTRIVLDALAAPDAEPIDPKPCESVEELATKWIDAPMGDSRFTEIRDLSAIIQSFLSAHDAEKDKRIKELENPWISVKDRMPKDPEWVIAKGDGAVMTMAYVGGSFKDWNEALFPNLRPSEVEYWMPIPKEPTP